MMNALEIFENGFEDYEKREYALDGPQTGSAEGQLYFFWPEDVVKIRKALSPTPPPVDGELAEVVNLLQWYNDGTEALKGYSVHCETHGYLTNMPTFLDRVYKALHILKKAATSQQAREFTEDEVAEIMCLAEYGEAIWPTIGHETQRQLIHIKFQVIRSLAAKNIIRLKDGGAE